jgi:ATP-dependent Clp protease protease subunit
MAVQVPLSQSHPGGCFFAFNSGIDRKPAEQLVVAINTAVTNGYKEVNLCMSSIGGILDHTYYAYNLIESLPITLITWNVGNIQSASALIFLCGDRRYATDNATFFFHQTGYDPPTARITEPYLEERLKAVQHDDNRSAGIIASKTGRPLQEVREWQNRELVMDTHAALAHGLIHEVRALAIPANALFHQIVI